MQRYDYMELNFEGLHMQKWNISTDRAQRLDGDICLVIMFTPRVTVIKMSKMARFLYFLRITPKYLWQFGQNTWMHLKDFIE